MSFQGQVKKVFVKRLVWILGVSLGASFVPGQFSQIVPVQKIYAAGQTIAAQGIKVENWGGGFITETNELPDSKNPCLRISTRNFFSGGMLLFDTPVNLSEACVPHENLLAFTFRPADLSVVLGKPEASSPSALGSWTTLRCILTMEDGLNTEMYIPLDTNDAQENGWRTVGIPLRAFPSIVTSLCRLKKIMLTGNTAGTFYLSDIQVIKDPTPIQGRILSHETNVALGDDVTFSAEGSDGSSVLRYEWSFNPKKWSQVDAVGKIVAHKFSIPGTYPVTLIISDIYGLKKPFIARTQVTVNP
jgi:hypothetical protein